MAFLWTTAILGLARVAGAVTCPTFVFNPANGATLPGGTEGGSYSARISVSGAAAPVTFSDSPSAPLPAGLRIVPTSDDPLAALIIGSPTVAGPRTFIITVSDKNGCTGFAEYGINISTVNACNPPVTLDPPGGSLQPVENGVPTFLGIEVGGDRPIYAEISGGPPGVVLTSIAAADPNGGGGNVASVNVPPETPPGTYTFQLTATDARECSITKTFSFTVVGPGAGCVIQLNANLLQQVRVGSSFPVTFTARNIGDASCVGPFTVNVGPGLPALTTTPGSDFTVTGTSGSSGQALGGTGTIRAGGFVGVGAFLAATTPGVIRVPVTLQFTSGTSTNDVINTIYIVDEVGSRDDLFRLDVFGFEPVPITGRIE
jgi:hypothetical protein